MFDADAPSSKLVIEKLNEPLVLERLRLIARRRAGSNASAEDLLQTALVRALDPDDSPWDPSRGPLGMHLSYVMRQSLDRILRKASAVREVPHGGIHDLPEQASLEPGPDEALEWRQTVATWRSMLKEVLRRLRDKHPLVARVVDLACRGIDEPEEQAKALGCPVSDVYRAFELLTYHGKVVRNERDQSERARMEGLRAGADDKTEAMS